MEIKGGLAVTSWEQLVAAPEGFAEGVRTLWWRRGEDGGFRIVAAQFRPGPTGLARRLSGSGQRSGQRRP